MSSKHIGASSATTAYRRSEALDSTARPASRQSPARGTRQHEGLLPLSRSAESSSASSTAPMAARVSLPSSSSPGATRSTELKSFIRDLENADRLGKQFPAAELDQKFQKVMVDAQNHLHPKLKARIFEVSDTDTESFRNAIINTSRGERWRAVINVEHVHVKAAPSHAIAVEVSRNGKKTSVIAIDSVWGCTDTIAVIPKALNGVKGAKLTIINTATQKDPVNCKIFALSTAKLMGEADELMHKLHDDNLAGKIGGYTAESDDGVIYKAVAGSELLDAKFFEHTTSREVFEDLPEHIQEELSAGFNANFKVRNVAGGTKEYNSSIEQQRLQFLHDALGD